MRQCGGRTRQGQPCRRPADRDGFCYQHGGSRLTRKAARPALRRTTVPDRAAGHQAPWWWPIYWITVGWWLERLRR
ncbi:DUF5763 domain-containing protein [Streptomyces macrosporus]|uniref:DUF5763 domain-containing protein n=1 Tax=Streptomyces macrosporus TaxID=44032 RepID=UPI003CD06161